MKRVRVGFVGAGGIAGRHVGNLMQFEDIAVAAVADPVFERARSQAERCGAHAYAHIGEMLDKEQLDALYICIPPFAHGDIELAAIERNLPFFVEKPLATNWATAAKIGARLAETDLVTAVGYHWRYLDTTEEAQALLSQTPARLVLGYWLDFTPPVGWWIHNQESGGQMVEQTTHIFDLARVLVGDITQVQAVGARTPRPAFPDADIYDVSMATLQFESGALGNMTSTCLLSWPHRIGLHLFGDGIAIEMTEFTLAVHKGDSEPQRQAQGDPFVREDRAFLDAVQGRANQIRAPYLEALKTHRVTTAAEQSAREQRTIDFQWETHNE